MTLPQRPLLCARGERQLLCQRHLGLRRTERVDRAAGPCHHGWQQCPVLQVGLDDCERFGARCRQPRLSLRCWILPGAGKGGAAPRHATGSTPGSRRLGRHLRAADSWLELGGALSKFDPSRHLNTRSYLGTGVSCPHLIIPKDPLVRNKRAGNSAWLACEEPAPAIKCWTFTLFA